MIGSRSMHRSIRLKLHKPNFMKRYVINLGSADPNGIFWNRVMKREKQQQQQLRINNSSSRLIDSRFL
ncbi:hypothetical protein GPALN_002077 [Globodera pallida]|nr:hypothetical protein GPALN_002077 [Globodera pallida]